MRRSALPALVASALLLSACGGSSEESNTDANAATAPGDLPVVAGEFGAEPEITYPESGPPESLEVEVLSEGDGAEVAAGDDLVADYIGQIWDGEAFDNSFTRSEPAVFPIGVSAVIKGWDEGLVGQNVGSRVLLSIPSELGYPEGQPSAGIEKGDTIVFVVDIIDTYGGTSAGDADAEIVDGALDDLPVDITGDLGEPAEITIKDGASAPEEATVSVLARGKGEETREGSTALHYVIDVWDSEESASTWEDEKVAVTTLGDGTTPFDVLIGEPVGSRALIQVPAVPGGDAMAILVDIVGQPTR